MLDKHNRVPAKARRAVAPRRDRRLVPEAPEPRRDATQPVPDPDRVLLAPEQRGEQADRHTQDDDAEDRRQDVGRREMPAEREEHERQHRQAELGEDVPDAGHPDVERHASAGESPGVEDRIGQPHGDRATRRERVRDRGRRLREHGGLADAEAGQGRLVRPPVGHEVEDRRGDQRPRLDRRQRLDRRPHVPSNPRTSGSPR